VKILALESSAKACSVAILDGETLLGEVFLQNERTHSENLLPAVHQLFGDVELRLADMDKIAVAIGPGAFTGLRIAAATAKGLAYATDKPLVGVSTLEAMAYGAKDIASGVLCPVMDARRAEVYHALFSVEENKVIRLIEDRAVSVEQMFAETKEKVTLLGDGAALCADWAKERGILFDLLPEERIYQRAYGVGLLAQTKEGQSVHDVNPRYIRPSSAEKERMEKMGTSQ